MDANYQHLSARRATTGWKRSSWCSPSGDNCVEVQFSGVAAGPGAISVGVRKTAVRAELDFARASWSGFLGGIRTGLVTCE